MYRRKVKRTIAILNGLETNRMKPQQSISSSTLTTPNHAIEMINVAFTSSINCIKNAVYLKLLIFFSKHHLFILSTCKFK